MEGPCVNGLFATFSLLGVSVVVQKNMFSMKRNGLKELLRGLRDFVVLSK